MKIAALITSFIIATSSVAMAQSRYTASVEGSWRVAMDHPVIRGPVIRGPVIRGPVIRDHRTHRAHAPAVPPRHAPPVRPLGWETLGSVYSITDGDMHFTAGPQSRFSVIQLESMAGKSRILGLTVYYADGSIHRIPMDTYINDENPSLAVTLPASRKGVRHIVVNGRNARESSFTVRAR